MGPAGKDADVSVITAALSDIQKLKEDLVKQTYYSNQHRILKDAERENLIIEYGKEVKALREEVDAMHEFMMSMMTALFNNQDHRSAFNEFCVSRRERQKAAHQAGDQVSKVIW
jgi:hypothetical protein